MLRTHFSESQFIVVSLKEGMFSNANCVFRTKFVDGVSTVTRTVNRVLADVNTNVSSSAGNEDSKALVTKKKANSKKRVAAGEDENAQEVEN